MTRITCKTWLIAACMVVATVSGAAGQTPPVAPRPAPGQVPYVLPPARTENFPALPPSRACNLKNVWGIWQLMSVYEVPIGHETADFTVSPMQYLFFRLNNTYGMYKSSQGEMPPETVRNTINKQQTVLQQYVVDKSGIVYFYQNRVPIDSQACFIVANPLGEFTVGEMLVLPPQGQSASRVLKVYRKIWSPNQNPAPNNQPRGQKRNK